MATLEDCLKFIERHLRYPNRDMNVLQGYCFEFACCEAEALGMEKRGESFTELCLIRKQLIVRGVYSLILSKNPDGVYEFDFPNQEETRKIVKNIYDRKK